MSKLEFDDKRSRMVEQFNASPGAINRRAAIAGALALQPGHRVLDVGSGPGHQACEMWNAVGETGEIIGIDPSPTAIDISSQRASELSNVRFLPGTAEQLDFDTGRFDRVMSSQVFEYLDNTEPGLGEMFRVLKPGGRILIHDTDWGTLLWRSRDDARMSRITKAWADHVIDPHLPQRLAPKLRKAGFEDISATPVVHLELRYDPSYLSAVVMSFIAGYVETRGIPADEIKAWTDDLRSPETDYFFSLTEYIFTAVKPQDG